jgi:hypothetical protein
MTNDLCFVEMPPPISPYVRIQISPYVIDELNVGYCCLDIFEMIVKTSERA